jgi:ADP-ribose pyrophosphatase YjhB (NUDIX family)
MRVSSRIMPTLFRLFGRLPETLRQYIVTRTSPAHRVGTAGIIRDGDRILLVRHTYRRGWGVPGGMMGWCEHPDDTIVREIREEVGLETVVLAEPYTYWLRRPRRVEVLYELGLAEGATAADARPTSPEIEEVAWFPDDGRPPMARKTLDMLAWVDQMREARAEQAANLG